MGLMVTFLSRESRVVTGLKLGIRGLRVYK